MKRINVVGTSATGKSTFSRALAEKLDLHYICLLYTSDAADE